MVELLEGLVQEVKWLQVLGWSNQFLLQRKLELEDGERDRVLEAAARAVDADGRTQEWIEEVGRLKGAILRTTGAMSELLKERGGDRTAGDRTAGAADEEATDFPTLDDLPELEPLDEDGGDPPDA